VSGKIVGLTYTADGNFLLAGQGTSLDTWSAKSGELIARIDSGEPFSRAAFSPDARLAAVDVAQSAAARSDTSEATPPIRTAPAATGKKSLRLLVVRSGFEAGQLDGIEGEVKMLTFTPDGQSVAVMDGKRFVIWDAASGKKTASFSIDDWSGATCLAKDGRTIAATVGGHVIYLLSISK
jgi:hypothetical protein